MAVERFPVEAGHIMMFARAIGDPNPVFASEAEAEATELGRMIAPPTFAQASAQFDPDYPLRPQIGVAWFGSGATPSGTMSTTTGADTETEGERPERSSAGSGESDQRSGSGGGAGGNAGMLHAEQHFEYHRHVGPGDVLSATSRPGATWQKQSRRAGTLHFGETITEYRDQHGELVITARSVGVRTERPIES
ncbi:MAG: MaoC family dehydratase N-terminal domain-containing protein [Actinomycetota bacterium]